MLALSEPHPADFLAAPAQGAYALTRKDLVLQTRASNATLCLP